MVNINGASAANCYQFSPRAGLRERLAALTPQNAGGRTISTADPIEGRLAVLRRYPDKTSDRYTTCTAPILSHWYAVEWENVTPGSRWAFYPADQFEPSLKASAAVLGGDHMLVGNASLRRTEGSDDPYFFDVHANSAGEMLPRPRRELTLIDSEGKNVAGAEVVAVRVVRANDGSSVRRSAPLQLRSDANGKIEIGELLVSDFNNVEFTVKHSDFGTTLITKTLNKTSFSLMQRFNPFLGRADHSLVLTASRRGSPAVDPRAVRGRIVDAAGHPVAGARLVARYDRRLGGVIPLSPDFARDGGGGVVFSDAEGCFNYLTTQRLSPAPGQKPSDVEIPKTFLVWIDFPGRPELPEMVVSLTPGEEHRIAATQAKRHCKVHILDRKAQKLDPAPLKLRLERYNPIALLGAAAPGPTAPLYDAASGEPFPKELDLLPGAYRVVSGSLGTTARAVLTPDSPAQLVFYFTALAAAAPGLKEALGVAAGSIPADVACLYQGKVIDGMTNRPLTGACVVANMFSEDRSLYFLSAATWQALRALREPFDFTGDPRLALIKAGESSRAEIMPLRLAQSAEDGRFTLSAMKKTQISSLVFMAEGYIGRNITRFQPPVNRIVALPEIKLYPAAALHLTAALQGKPEDRYTQIALDYTFTDSKRGAWAQTFPGPRERFNQVQDRLWYDDEIVSGRAESAVVPAGVRFKLTLRPPDRSYDREKWRPVTLEREIELGAGETLDLGEIVLPRK